MPRPKLSDEEKKERALKLALARMSNAGKRAETRFQIGHFAVYRLDEYNWTVQDTKGGPQEFRYFPHLADCLEVLLHLRIDEHARGDLRTIAQAVKEVVAEIRAFKKTLEDARNT
jgi:hypothetical protein